MQIPPEKIQEILERTDLAALVSRHVELRMSGGSLKGRCPFHEEKTPSFYVHPEKRYFKCFGCEAGGDAISFWKRITGRSFTETVQDLAQEAGVVLEQQVDPNQNARNHLRETNQKAQRFFEECLWHSPAGRPGREYLEKRGVHKELCQLFGLGYSALSWNDLSSQFVKQGILEWGMQIGLCASRPQGKNGAYDVFRGRLMIPIRSSNGCTIAFGGRLVEKMNRLDRDHAPKYLNSCESLLYRKSETLFGLDLSKNEIRRSKTAILVEGYFDVISLYGTGIQNVVALCSTALTNAHWNLLERLGASELVLLLDGDIAGTKAVERLAPTLLSLGVRARVATLPENDDPDTFVLREGRSALDEVISSAPPLSEHLLERFLPKERAVSLEEKMAALAYLRPVLEGMAPSMAKTIFWSQLSDRLGVSESQIRAYLRQPTNGNTPRLTRKNVDSKFSSSDRESTASTSGSLDIHEELFAALIISDPTLKNEPESRFSDELRSLQLRMLLESENPYEDLASLPLAIRQGIERQLREIEFSLSDADAKRKALRESSIRLRLLRIEERKVSKQIEIQQAAARNASEEEIGQLQLEHTQLAALRSRLREERNAIHSQSSRRQQL